MFVLIVVGGLAAGAGVYGWKQPRAQREVERRIAAAPRTTEGRVAAWLEYGAPSIHQRLQTARISWQQPWLVTHTVTSSTEGEPSAVYGLDLTQIGPEAASSEGARVVLRLPEPTLLARTTLVGRNARGVPAFSAAEAPSDPAELLRAKVTWLVEKLATALAKDIEGARLEVVVESTEAP